MDKIYAKKSLGQHFLNSKHVLSEIIQSANIKPGEKVLEIGPGTGVLTEALLNSGAKVTAIEKDTRSVFFLQVKYAEQIKNGSLVLQEGDILELDSANLGFEETKYSIVANIPYYITGAILEKFLEHSPRPEKMVLLVQKEVAERILAREGKESILSVSVKAFGTPKMISKVPKGAFTPPPTVDSAVLAVYDINGKTFEENGLNTGYFFKLLKTGFAHKRKFLIKNLEEVLPKENLAKIWQKLTFNPKIRAEDLKTSNWLDLAKEANKI